MHIDVLGAAGEVTGSCFLIECQGRRLLIDCGLFQGSRESEARNAQPFGFDAKTIDAVILTHAHIDHSGRLPLLVKSGYGGPIYTHRATVDLCRIMLRDSAYLSEKDAEWENRKRERKGLAPVEPLYTRADAETAIGQFEGLEYGVEREIFPGVRMRLRDAGHILGSAIVELWLSEGKVRRKLVFSGDLGHKGQPILKEPALVDTADLVFLETTYGDRAHRSWEATWAEMGDILGNSHNHTGNILIPAFAVGRTQELLYTFRQNFDAWNLNRWRIFLDSPMAIETTEVYRRHSKIFDADAQEMRRESGPLFDLPNLHMSRTSDQSMKLNKVRSGAIIIAGSGMCTGGRIKHHLKHNVWRENTHVIFVGFQARGTPGRAMVDGAKHIRLWGETIKVAAHIHTVGGLSAHADADGLTAWYEHIEGRPPAVLVHGEPQSRDALAERFRSKFDARILTPELGARIDLKRFLGTVES